MRVIYRGEAQCPCEAKLNDWYGEDRTRIDHGARVECDCGRVWVFLESRDGTGHCWDPE